MQRVIARLGQPLIRRDGEEHVGRLAGNLELEEVVVLEDLGVRQRALDHRLRARLAVFLQEVAFERAGVDADPHRAAVVAGRLDHLAHPLGRADIAGIDAQTGGAALAPPRSPGGNGNGCRRRSAPRLAARSASAPAPIPGPGTRRERYRRRPAPSAWICSTVALMSLVTVLVIDWTVIGASPPTGTLPT